MQLRTGPCTQDSLVRERSGERWERLTWRTLLPTAATVPSQPHPTLASTPPKQTCIAPRRAPRRHRCSPARVRAVNAVAVLDPHPLQIRATRSPLPTCTSRTGMYGICARVSAIWQLVQHPAVRCLPRARHESTSVLPSRNALATALSTAIKPTRS